MDERSDERYDDLLSARRVAALIGSIAERTIVQWVNSGKKYPPGTYEVQELASWGEDKRRTKRFKVSLRYTRQLVDERDAHKLTPYDELRMRVNDLSDTVTRQQTDLTRERDENGRLAYLVEQLTQRLENLEASPSRRSRKQSTSLPTSGESTSPDEPEGGIDDAKHDRHTNYRDSPAPPVPSGWFPWSTYCALHDMPPSSPRHWAMTAIYKRTIVVLTRDQEANKRNDPDFTGWLLEDHIVQQLVNPQGLDYFWEKCRTHDEFVACGHCKKCREHGLVEGWYDATKKKKHLNEEGRPLVVEERAKERAIFFAMLDSMAE